ncbi:MAG: hypothetical protein ABI343_05050 [Burkholderiaceae bacterium]
MIPAPKAEPPQTTEVPAPFAPDSTQTFQARMPAAPTWFSSMLAGTSREKNRLRLEIAQMRGAARLLMKQRNGGKWTAQDVHEIKNIARSLSSVSPYLLIWALPGSVLILPLLAWHLDTRRKRRMPGSSK